MSVDTVSDAELKKVIADFLEMGHMENIVAMFRRDSRYYAWTGEILKDERFNVRLGLTIVFEELQALGVPDIARALPSLASLLNDDSALIRGEAIGILDIIGTREATELITTMADDNSPQVREMVELAQNKE
jgi:HEAT repeat protein